MVDKDMSEINALNEVFPESDVLLCWYHVLQVIWIFNMNIYKKIPVSLIKIIIIHYKSSGSQAVVRWLMKSDSGVSGPHSSNTRREVLDSFKKNESLCYGSGICILWLNCVDILYLYYLSYDNTFFSLMNLISFFFSICT